MDSRFDLYSAHFLYDKICHYHFCSVNSIILEALLYYRDYFIMYKFIMKLFAVEAELQLIVIYIVYKDKVELIILSTTDKINNFIYSIHFLNAS